jgi:hypothetical protein
MRNDCGEHPVGLSTVGDFAGGIGGFRCVVWRAGFLLFGYAVMGNFVRLLTADCRSDQERGGWQYPAAT